MKCLYVVECAMHKTRSHRIKAARGQFFEVGDAVSINSDNEAENLSRKYEWRRVTATTYLTPDYIEEQARRLGVPVDELLRQLKAAL